MKPLKFNFKSVLAFILTLSMIMSLSVLSASANDDVIYPVADEKHMTSQDDFSDSVNVSSLKSYIRQQLALCVSEIDISSFNVPYSDIKSLSNLIYDDIPEAFHLEGYAYSYGGNIITRLYFTYNCTASQYKAMMDKCTAAVDKILDGVRYNTNLNAVQKALLVHDRLAVWCEYDVINYEQGSIPDESYNMYGALVNKVSVCQGYAEAYEYMLELIGIGCYICESDVLNHAWNIVEIGGEEYHVDVTWDDLTNDVTGRVNHDNFLLSTDGIYNSGHTAYDYNDEPDDTRFDNAFWKNSKAEFQLIGNELYYVDNVTEEVKKYSNNSVLFDVTATWYANGGKYWTDNFTRLSSDGTGLLYSQPDGVYRYDLASRTQTTVWQPTMPSGGAFSVFGFTLADGYLICDINDSPSFSLTTKRDYQQRKFYEKSVCNGNSSHSPEIIPGKDATCQETGLTQGERCSVCGVVLVEQTVIPVVDHDYVTQIVPADCVNRGYTTYTCSMCGYSYKSDYTEITGHRTENGYCEGCQTYMVEEGHSIQMSFSSATRLSGVEWKTSNDKIKVIDSGCNTYDSEEGKMVFEYYAIIYGEISGDSAVHIEFMGITIAKEKVIVNSHKNHTPVVVPSVPAQCEKTGLTEGSECSFCGEVLVPQTVIPATGHISGEWEKSDVEGYICRKCTICGIILDTRNDETTKPDETETTTKPDIPKVLIGDVNGDGKLTAMDARLVLRIAAHLDIPDKDMLLVADYNGSGRVTASDARLLLRKAAGLD